MNLNISKFSYLLIIFISLVSNDVKDVLSCQMRYEIENNLYFRHIIGILLFFAFIMSVGGWSFNTKIDDMLPNSPLSANAFDSLVYAVLIYIIFLLSSRCKFWINIIYFSLLLLIYIINTQRDYYYIRKLIDDDTNSKLINLEHFLVFISVFILIVGVIDYLIFQKKEYGSNFSYSKFIFGVNKCSKLA